MTIARKGITGVMRLRVISRRELVPGYGRTECDCSFATTRLEADCKTLNPIDSTTSSPDVTSWRGDSGSSSRKVLMRELSDIVGLYVKVIKGDPVSAAAQVMAQNRIPYAGRGRTSGGVAVGQESSAQADLQHSHHVAARTTQRLRTTHVTQSAGCATMEIWS